MKPTKRKSLNKQRNKRLKFSKVVVIFVLIQVFLYTWFHLFISAKVGVEIAPTTTVAFYAFCGAEAGLLAWLKKLDKPEDNNNEENTESGERPYKRNFDS